MFCFCSETGAKLTDEERKKGIERGHINPKCCARYVLANKPDFLAQEEWFTQVAHEAGFEIIFYPKYHRELNYIEMIWGWVKNCHRRTCTYNYKDLRDRLIKTFDESLP